MSTSYELAIEFLENSIRALREVLVNEEKVDLDAICNLELTLTDLINDLVD